MAPQNCLILASWSSRQLCMFYSVWFSLIMEGSLILEKSVCKWTPYYQFSVSVHLKLPIVSVFLKFIMLKFSEFLSLLFSFKGIVIQTIHFLSMPLNLLISLVISVQMFQIWILWETLDFSAVVFMQFLMIVSVSPMIQSSYSMLVMQPCTVRIIIDNFLFFEMSDSCSRLSPWFLERDEKGRETGEPCLRLLSAIFTLEQVLLSTSVELRLRCMDGYFLNLIRLFQPQYQLCQQYLDCQIITMVQQSQEEGLVGAQDDDLVELEPDKESMVTRLLAPKVIILSFLSLIFVSKNIYNIFIIGTPQSQEPPAPPKNPPPEDDSVWERIYGYFILTVVLFVVYILMVRANDRALLQKIEEDKAKKMQQEQKRKLQQQAVQEIAGAQKEMAEARDEFKVD